MIPALDYLRELNMLYLCLRFILAVLCGGLIGWHQGRRQQTAGLRTHLLVCVGAAATMIVNQYIFTTLGEAGDPGRIGAQVVSGIGFLGAGTIIVTGRSQVRGLTTAAGLWASACMGLAAGAGYFEAAIIMALLLYLVLVAIGRVDETRVKVLTTITVYLEFETAVRFSRVLENVRALGWHVCELERMSQDGSAVTAVRLVLQLDGKREDHEFVLTQLRAIPGVLFAEEL